MICIIGDIKSVFKKEEFNFFFFWLKEKFNYLRVKFDG